MIFAAVTQADGTVYVGGMDGKPQIPIVAVLDEAAFNAAVEGKEGLAFYPTGDFNFFRRSKDDINLVEISRYQIEKWFGEGFKVALSYHVESDDGTPVGIYEVAGATGFNFDHWSSDNIPTYLGPAYHPEP